MVSADLLHYRHVSASEVVHLDKLWHRRRESRIRHSLIEIDLITFRDDLVELHHMSELFSRATKVAEERAVGTSTRESKVLDFGKFLGR